jgi:hypothetical protein
MFSIKNQFRILKLYLSDAASAELREAVAGCEYVLAGVVAFPSRHAQARARVDCEGTRCALRMPHFGRGADVDPVVLTSSLAAKPQITQARWQVISLPGLIRK